MNFIRIVFVLSGNLIHDIFFPYSRVSFEMEIDTKSSEWCSKKP